ncbi:von Willebrand and RING finger domain-containing protein [Cucurbitaria berberidis CBS 394.84]|uniref:von Willebrand and RING finger domain-containing protein n=1 Tax=Cucurbitaria berberidis CBS 394.84 TaxID=1168544 RepID=A0A9P4GL57_9PLEO|nr:von Willebrand and RING finger domain-containing protein [Cucurbitaria berberidis CBS 394.84]KAF1847469.1 von Willebrand and RING finger domain-containing protein [Cucurbitaria berberidis CBS 394.84]
MSFLGSFRPNSRSSHSIHHTSTPKPFTSHTQRSNATLDSRGPPSSARGMAGVMDIERTRTRRERTFVGSECAVCEEDLSYTLRGERVLQLSCSHVAHEACFYEYIREFESQHCPTCNATLGLDTSRGGNFDLEKLSTIVRSVQSESSPQPDTHRSASNTPTPWDSQTIQSDTQNGTQSHGRSRNGSDASGRYLHSTQTRQRDSSHSRDRGSDRGGSISRQHGRSDSGATGLASSNDYAATHEGRRHDYDVQSMETSLSSPRGLLKSPIPAPTVTVRSEFPTLSRSRQQQSLTCLVTVEVVEGKWRADPSDMRGPPPLPSIASAPESFGREKSPPNSRQFEPQYEPTEVLDEMTEDLHARVDNWHGLDFSRFGKLRLHGHIRVGKDRQSWQELECYLFSEMLICVKEKKTAPQPQWDGSELSVQKKNKCTLKGSILIKKHLNQVEHSQDDMILTLSLSVAELPSFHLQFQNRSQLELWRRALMDIRLDFPTSNRMPDYELDNSGNEEDDYRRPKRVSSVNSSYGAARSTMTAPTEYTSSRAGIPEPRLSASIHVPIDVVVVIPVSSSMQGLKINLLRDTLRFLVYSLGERDRMGLVTFGSSGGGVPIVGMTSKAWRDWPKVLDSIRPVGQKSLRADVVDGANVAMDLLMQRKSSNPLSSILLISDSSTSDTESVDFVISRAEAAKVSIHSFGLGLTHKPDTMIELSTRTKASYTYVKDWMMLRECVAGCLGSLQNTSHQNVKLKLRLPEGSPAKFVKISGALQITKRAAGRDAEAALGDLRFGDKRDILVQLAISPDSGSPEQLPQDPWETIVSGLEALGGPLDQDDSRTLSVEEVPLIQADLTYGDILREGTLSHLPRPSLLAITLLPSGSKKNPNGRPPTPPIPPHPHVVQRRMELLTSDMLTRALTLVSRGQHERAHHLLKETRTILKGLGKGGLPPLPPPGHRRNDASSATGSTGDSSPTTNSNSGDMRPRTPSPHADSPFTPAAGIDARTMRALDAELESSLEWINHPAVFGRDSRKAVLQAIGVISSQRAYTFRTPAESLWAERIAGVKRLSERSREWRESGDQEALMEEN